MDADLKNLISRLYETDVRCPSREVFDIPSKNTITKETEQAAHEAAGDLEGETGFFFVQIEATSRGALSTELDKNVAVWEQHCKPLLNALAGDILHFIRMMKRDEVAMLGRTSRRGVQEAPVYADYADTEYDGLAEVDIRADKRVVLRLRFKGPLVAGDFKHSYP
jgi:hypothetical protein